MEDDVDIYADLPSLDLNPENKDQDCNCKELKKEHSLLLSKLENLQRTNANLKNNLSSLLKTARAEIARKERMIDDLRQQLNDITFRRSNRNEGFSTHRSSQQRNVTRKYEDVSSIHSEESETEPYEIGFRQNKYKLQNDVNRVSTVFGERLHKKIMETEEEEKKQKALLKLGAEVKTEDIPKNSIVENDKENGSQFSINNNDNETNVRRCSSSEPPYRKNLVKRTSEEDTCKHKRLKIESNEDKTTTKEMDYLTRYDLTENPAQYEMKTGLKSEDQLDTTHSFKKEGAIPFRVERRAVSEYQDTKQDQSCANGWRSEAKSNSSKDHDNSNTRNGLAYSLRNSRSASTSNYASNSGYRKNGHKYNSPPRRSYSRSRSDYESSHRLRERSSKTYREKKYDDYKYDSRYKNDRLRRNYDSEENDRKTRYKRREHDDLREKSRPSSSDAEDRKSNSSYKKKYENRRIKKEIINVSNDKKPHESKVVVEINSRESSSRTTVSSTMNYTYSAEENIEKHKNVSEIKSINSTKSISAHKEHPVCKESTSVVNKDLDILEEGEILDSPKKKISSAKISNDDKIEENNIKIILVEDKNKVVSVNASRHDKSIQFKNYVNSTKQLEMDSDTKEIEVVSCLPQENLKDCEKIIQSTSSKCVVTADETHNCIKAEDTLKSHINDNLTNSTTRNIGTPEQVHDSDIDGNNKNNADEKSEDFITETAIKIKQVTDSNIESVSQIQELDHLSIESTKKEETSIPNIESAVEVTKVNNFNSDNSIHKIDSDKLRTSVSKVVTKVEAVLDCDIVEKDENRAPSPIESETFHQTSNKSCVEALYLNDHNYVQSFPVNASDLDANQKPSMSLECTEDVSETAVSKETKVEKIINVQSISVKRTMSSVVKNKKDQQSKGILISHRRKAVILSDSNASMTVLMNTNVANTPSVINNCNDNDSTLKPRACKTSRVFAKATCK
ncbi:origin recognition complex subunit 1 isoform X1 [Solenopsis invicta]|uniref:origin recognition complex subunit 1 isoform X1 n=2 Tax=Solenopsis invicta TaxID=13686 RepID=UPI00193CE837|nr:origin recognition complex subunit 1 isoform X1 [Solenopsis invicta]